MWAASRERRWHARFACADQHKQHGVRQAVMGGPATATSRGCGMQFGLPCIRAQAMSPPLPPPLLTPACTAYILCTLQVCPCGRPRLTSSTWSTPARPSSWWEKPGPARPRRLRRCDGRRRRVPRVHVLPCARAALCACCLCLRLSARVNVHGQQHVPSAASQPPPPAPCLPPPPFTHSSLLRRATARRARRWCARSRGVWRR